MDFNGILQGASDSPNNEKKTDKTEKKSKAKKKNKNAESVPALVPAFSPSDNINNNNDADGLPPDLLQTIQGIINQWCIDNDIPSINKASALQWGAVCMFIGQYIKNNKILLDYARTNERNSKTYDIKKIYSLVDIWVYLCQSFGKVPLVNDFIYFSGVSRGWFYGDNGHNNNTLTSAGGGLAKKLTEIQAAAIGSGIVDGRENPTGKIYFSKAILGWSENGSRLPASDNIGENNAVLPDLSGYLLTDNKKQ